MSFRQANYHDGEAPLQATSPKEALSGGIRDLMKSAHPQSNGNGPGSDHGDENQQPGDENQQPGDKNRQSSNDFDDPGNHQAERTASASSWVTTSSSASLPGTGAAEQQPPNLVASRKWGGAEVLPALAKMKDIMKKKTKQILHKLHQRQNNSSTASPPAFLPTKSHNSTLASTPTEAASLASELCQRVSVWHHPRCRPADHPAVDAALNNFVRHLGETERRGCPRAAEHGRNLADDAYEELEMITGRRRQTASAAFLFRLLELYIYDDEEEEEEEEEE
ncbi:hypothetical protein DL764_010067 [Monosporascus ibericus]|uniref:Uncharacterized protein n=1 Tax=Monosporascus ibericus TaxID=155417 RepID=A0A4V1X8T1_9PEZI|nr:hypothetical protein DL764_010067 [Monosporascus ibericus]